MKKVLKNVNVITCAVKDEILNNVNVFIDDNVIKEISKNSNFNGYEVIDLKDKYVIPGLINLHSHLFGSGKPSKNLGGGKSQEKIIKFVKTKVGSKVLDKMIESHCKQMLFSGVTTCRSVGDFYYSDVRVRNKINNNEVIGPRLIVSGPALTVTSGHGDSTFAISADSCDDHIHNVRLNVKNDVDFIKVCITGGVLDSKKKGEPGLLRMTLKEARAIVDEAHKNGYAVASHTESSRGMEVAVKSGVDTIEHGAIFDDELCELMQKQQTKIVLTISPALPLANLKPEVTLLNDLTTFNTKIVLDNMIKGAKKALENNIMVGLGTDASCPFVTHYNMYRELYYYSKYLNVSNYFALMTATLINAKILKLDNEIGSVEKNKIADLVIYNNSPLDDLLNLKDPYMVIKEGKIYNKLKYKKYKFIDEELNKLI